MRLPRVDAVPVDVVPQEYRCITLASGFSFPFMERKSTANQHADTCRVGLEEEEGERWRRCRRICISPINCNIVSVARPVAALASVGRVTTLIGPPTGALAPNCARAM